MRNRIGRWLWMWLGWGELTNQALQRLRQQNEELYRKCGQNAFDIQTMKHGLAKKEIPLHAVIER